MYKYVYRKIIFNNLSEMNVLKKYNIYIIIYSSNTWGNIRFYK